MTEKYQSEDMHKLMSFESDTTGEKSLDFGNLCCIVCNSTSDDPSPTPLFYK